MPYINLQNTSLYYEETGTGPETVVFSHGLLWSAKMFAAQVEQLQSRYRVITYDHRGQGKSKVPASGYDMDTLTEDAAELIRNLNAKPCHFVGLSMGGFVGMRLASRYPQLLKSLVLMETSAQAEPEENIPKYRMLNRVIKLLGAWAVKKPVMKIMFGQKFLHDKGRIPLRKYWEKELTSNNKTITRSVEGVIKRKGVEQELKNINCPTLVIVGDQDVATVPAKARFIQQHIPGAELVIIPGAGHSSSIEEPEFVNRTIINFLAKISAND
ncbi:alpha/beta fold hydrolase [Nafulsella turpanensis]|uniref:alpha/beta fold hydrolase n=1 Tax=Nafulsella turpanensis TaxID=1265690 RepID=UPI00034B73D2|nr:alpha/beta hydrolase [Nafulsella turpanensis]